MRSYAPCGLVALLLAVAACGDNGGDTGPDAQVEPDAGIDATPPTGNLRLMSANTSSGNQQRYEAEGLRIFQGLDPDIVLIQEFNAGDESDRAIRAFVDEAFGPSFQYHREPITTGISIPNGIVSRHPILAAGIWDDPEIADRSFAWARIDVPGDRDLWAISVHLKSGSARDRRLTEAKELTKQLAAIPERDYVVLGGDFNTTSRTEDCVNELGKSLVMTGPWPADAAGDGDTNAGRNDPYDWVAFDKDLAALAVPTRIGAQAFPAGLVFDSRRYAPLAEVAPVQVGDSGVTGMQHMAVVRDVHLP